MEEILATEVSDDETPEEIHASLVHTLGNLPDPQRTDDPREVLEAEGVRFDELDRADPEQRMTATNLAAAMELDTA